MRCLPKIIFIYSILVFITVPVTAQTTGPITAIKAGRLIDPETGTATANQIILIEGERIKAVGANIAIPSGATIIDLSKLAVLPVWSYTHPHGADLQRAAGKQLLLSDVCNRLDGVTSDSSCLKWHSASQLRLHSDSGRWEQRNVCRYRAKTGDRTRMATWANSDSVGTHHRQHGGTILAHSGDVQGAQTHVPGVHRCRYTG